MYETLLVNGVDLATFGCFQVLDGLYATAVPRGDDLTIPGMVGEIWTDKPYGAGSIDIGMILSGTTTTEWNDQYRALKTLIQPGTLLTLERHMSYTTGNEQHTATATCAAGISPTVSLMKFGKLTIQFKILSGVWYGTSPVTLISSTAGPFDVTVTGVGEAATHKVQISMTPGCQIFSLEGTLSGNNPIADETTPIDIDVLNYTGTQSGLDVSSALAWSGRYMFRVVPGANRVIFSVGGSGAASVSYYPAYL